MKPRAGIALPAFVIVLSIFLRFWGLADLGLVGSDTVYYTSLAESWSRGDRVFHIAGEVEVFRPIVLALYELAIRILGDNDASIKRLNVTLDCVNVILIMVLGRIISASPLPGTVAALIYACTPYGLELARSELTHVASTLFILLATGSFLRWQGRPNGRDPKGLLLLLLAGAFIGAASLSHEELILVAPAFAAALVARLVQAPADASKAWVPLMAAFSAGLLVCLPALLRHAGNAAVVAQATAQRATSALPLRIARFLWNALVVYGSWPLLLATGATVLWLLAQARRRARPWEEGTAAITTLLLIVLCYVIGFAVLSALFFPRFFLPLYPLALLAAMIGLYRLVSASTSSGALQTSVLVAYAAVAIPCNLGNYQNMPTYREREFPETRASLRDAALSNPMTGLASLRTRSYETAWPRVIFDTLSARVHSEARLLVAASIAFPLPGRRVMQTSAYFGDDADYLIDHTEPLADLVQRRKVAYVLYTRILARPELLERSTYPRYLGGGRWDRDAPLHLGASVGIAAGQYSIEAEWAALRHFLESRGARMILLDGTSVDTVHTPPSPPNYAVFAL